MSNLHDAEIAYNRASHKVKQLEGSKKSKPDEYKLWVELKCLAETAFDIEVNYFINKHKKRLTRLGLKN